MINGEMLTALQDKVRWKVDLSQIGSKLFDLAPIWDDTFNLRRLNEY